MIRVPLRSKSPGPRPTHDRKCPDLSPRSADRKSCAKAPAMRPGSGVRAQAVRHRRASRAIGVRQTLMCNRGAARAGMQGATPSETQPPVLSTTRLTPKLQNVSGRNRLMFQVPGGALCPVSSALPWRMSPVSSRQSQARLRGGRVDRTSAILAAPRLKTLASYAQAWCCVPASSQERHRRPSNPGRPGCAKRGHFSDRGRDRVSRTGSTARWRARSPPAGNWWSGGPPDTANTLAEAHPHSIRACMRTLSAPCRRAIPGSFRDPVRRNELPGRMSLVSREASNGPRSSSVADSPEHSMGCCARRVSALQRAPCCGHCAAYRADSAKGRTYRQDVSGARREQGREPSVLPA